MDIQGHPAGELWLARLRAFVLLGMPSAKSRWKAINTIFRMKRMKAI
ncbi:MAG: hypothetical protein WC712_10055 [Candidatus Brocadiia bacterium]